MPRAANPRIRNLDPDVPAPLRKTRLATIAPADLDELLEGPPEQNVTVPVAALRAWRDHIREPVGGEIEARREAMRDLQRRHNLAFTHAQNCRELLKRLVKYHREDGAKTPGSTRLARLVDEVSDYLTKTAEGSESIAEAVVAMLLGGRS